LIYLDSSVALAELLDETEKLAQTFWQANLVASRLLVYELSTTLHRRGLGETLAADRDALLQTILLLDLAPEVLERALRPYPVHLRTLDALHLATVIFVAQQTGSVHLATYDRRLAAAGTALGIPLASLE
jgi:predicted nucleic acid-binding protein